MGAVRNGRGFKALDRLWDCRMSSASNRELCAAAARNNAIWCDAMARGHGAAGEFTTAAWINQRPAPRFHPNLVTLSGPHEERAHREALHRLLQSPPGQSSRGPGWAVKDSFAALALDVLGFDLLFEAQWIHRPAGGFSAAASSAERVTGAAMLAAWEQAWRGDRTDVSERVFPPALLQEPDHAVIAAMWAGAVVAGCVATRSDGVLGISNLFAPADDDGALRAACLDVAARFAPAVPLVGYERDESLARMKALGFTEIGALRIWMCG
jgi:hypothetical protein